MLYLFNDIIVTKTALVLFPTFSNANWLRRVLSFDIQCSTKYMAAILDFKNGVEQYLWRHKSRATLITWSLEGGVSRTSPSSFDTIHSIDLKFGKYNKLHLYFQLSGTTLCLISLNGNNSQINDVTGGRHLGFLNI